MWHTVHVFIHNALTAPPMTHIWLWMCFDNRCANNFFIQCFVLSYIFTILCFLLLAYFFIYFFTRKQKSGISNVLVCVNLNKITGTSHVKPSGLLLPFCYIFILPVISSCRVHNVPMCLSVTEVCFSCFHWQYAAHSLFLCRTVRVKKLLHSPNSHHAKMPDIFLCFIFYLFLPVHKKRSKNIVNIHIRTERCTAWQSRRLILSAWE